MLRVKKDPGFLARLKPLATMTASVICCVKAHQQQHGSNGADFLREGRA